MSRKKITEPEQTEETNLTNQPKTEQEKAVDEIFEQEVLNKLENKEVEEKEEETEAEVEAKAEEEKQEEEEEKEEKKEEEIEAEKTTDEKKEEVKEQEGQEQIKDDLLKKYGLTKFKKIEDALEAYKELESAYGKAQTIISSYQKGVIPQEIQEGVEGALNIVSRPRVRFEAPDPSLYNLDDGTFDIQGYLTDALNNYTLSLQKSLVFGELASALYTVLSHSVVDKYSGLKRDIESEKQAEIIASELREVYPQLEKDKEIAELFQAAVLKRHQDKNGPLTKEDFFEIAKKVVGLKYKTTPKEQPVETGGFTGQMGASEKPETAPKSEQEQAVDELFQTYINKKSSGLF